MYIFASSAVVHTHMRVLVNVCAARVCVWGGGEGVGDYVYMFAQVRPRAIAGLCLGVRMCTYMCSQACKRGGLFIFCDTYTLLHVTRH